MCHKEEIGNRQLAKDFKRMFNNKIKTDVDIVLDDGTNIKVRNEVNFMGCVGAREFVCDNLTCRTKNNNNRVFD